VRRFLTGLVLLAGCSSHSTMKLPLPGPTAKVPDGPPLVTPGEHMTYRLALQGIELASYEIAVGDTSEVAGKQTIVVQSHAKTVGIGALVKVDDTFSSWIDVATGRPVRWVCDEYATNGSDKERTDANLAGRTDDTVPIQFHLNDEPPQSEPQKVSMPDVWDYNAFLVALRSWEGPPGATITAEVLRSRFLWHVVMKIHGKQQLHTDLGDLPALQLDGHTYKLGRDGKRLSDSDERDFRIWISDDDGRVPLQITAKTDYGDIEMKITDYQPGTGKRLRN
jgi:hypothetical protein